MKTIETIETMISHYKQLHSDMGCKGCRYCDIPSLGNSACCTYPGPLEIQKGICLIRQPIETNTRRGRTLLSERKDPENAI